MEQFLFEICFLQFSYWTIFPKFFVELFFFSQIFLLHNIFQNFLSEPFLESFCWKILSRLFFLNNFFLESESFCWTIFLDSFCWTIYSRIILLNNFFCIFFAETLLLDHFLLNNFFWNHLLNSFILNLFCWNIIPRLFFVEKFFLN